VLKIVFPNKKLLYRHHSGVNYLNVCRYRKAKEDPNYFSKDVILALAESYPLSSLLNKVSPWKILEYYAISLYVQDLFLTRFSI